MKKIIILCIFVLFIPLNLAYSPPGYNSWTLVLPSDYSAPGYNNFTLVLGEVIPPSDTCTYSGSGNWQIDCDDTCNLTINTDLLGNNITINGTGTTTITANLTNYTQIDIYGTDSSNRCVVECKNNGCFK